MLNPGCPRISREALLALFAGLSLPACPKSVPEASPETPAMASSAVPDGANDSAPHVGAKEVPGAAPSGSANGEKAGACVPGGCAEGKCGGKK